jgi:hypothetical protein
MHPHVHHAGKAAVHHEGAAREAAKLGREALGDAADVSCGFAFVTFVDGVLVYRQTIWFVWSHFPIVRYWSSLKSCMILSCKLSSYEGINLYRTRLNSWWSGKLCIKSELVAFIGNFSGSANMKRLCNACGMNSESWSLLRLGMQN